MESLPKNLIIHFKPDTLQYIRDQYGLNNIEQMNEAIDILNEWIQKQEHFEKKIFSRDYLERVIINNKGSIEKSKKKLDRMCTLRTLLPELFVSSYLEKPKIFHIFNDSLLPTMTPDYCRVHFFKVMGQKFDSPSISLYLKYILVSCDYLQTQDYSDSLIYVADWRDGNILDFIMSLNVVELKKVADVIIKGCNLRIKGIHLVTSSKAIDALVSILKQILSAKIGERIRVHTTLESLYEYVPKNLLPEEYGGKEKPLKDLCEQLYNEVTGSNFVECRKELQKARTNEAYRQTDKFNDEYMGISGTFRALSVD